MPCLRRLLPVAAALLAAGAPRATQAQSASGSAMASATVLVRPLTMLALSWTAAGELRIQLDGCGTGAITVDARLAGATTRAARLPVEAGTECGLRVVIVPLPQRGLDAQEYIVTLQQSDGLLSPAFAQVTLPASAVAVRASLAY